MAGGRIPLQTGSLRRGGSYWSLELRGWSHERGLCLGPNVTHVASSEQSDILPGGSRIQRQCPEGAPGSGAPFVYEPLKPGISLLGSLARSGHVLACIQGKGTENPPVDDKHVKDFRHILEPPQGEAPHT